MCMVEMAIFNIQRAITLKVGKQELRFKCSVCHLMVFNICVKFHENMSSGFKVMERTQKLLTDTHTQNRKLHTPLHAYFVCRCPSLSCPLDRLPPGGQANHGQVAPRGATCPGISYPPPWLSSPPGGRHIPAGLSCPPGVKINQLGYLAPHP